MLRLARKRYVCGICGQNIAVGEYYEHGKVRLAKFREEDDNQIGIEYAEWKHHVYICADFELL